FESAMFRNSGTLMPLSTGETNFFSILENLPGGHDPITGGAPLNWFAVKSAAFAPINAGDPKAPLGIRVPGGQQGSEANIEAPLGYPAEQRYLPMQAIFFVPRGVYGAGAHDRTLNDPSLLLTEYCKILLQLPENAGKRTIDLFGGSVENLTVAAAMRMGTLEFFKDTATGELLAVLNFLLVDGVAPDEFGKDNEPVTYDGGLLRVYDGLMDGKFKERLWLAESNYVNINESITNPGGQDSNPGTNPNPGKNPNPDTSPGIVQGPGGAAEASGGGGCNAAAGIFVLPMILLAARRNRKR
ncbi:MAG: hypothetical protein FWG09_06685, partial [Synergistaceae bacterium]|nr:hypothetical protein [Synergistaceae bacterium]